MDLLCFYLSMSKELTSLFARLYFQGSVVNNLERALEAKDSISI